MNDRNIKLTESDIVLVKMNIYRRFAFCSRPSSLKYVGKSVTLGLLQKEHTVKVVSSKASCYSAFPCFSSFLTIFICLAVLYIPLLFFRICFLSHYSLLRGNFLIFSY